MRGKGMNSLIVIENGRLFSYELDHRQSWEVGRASRDHIPDIVLQARTVSRKHGSFQNMDGNWFYLDNQGKNGTVYNGRHIRAGLGGRIRPVILKNRDVLIFGCSEKPETDYDAAWAVFLERSFPGGWRVSDTRGLEKFCFTDGTDTATYYRPAKGTVVENANGIAVYMGALTYAAGNMDVIGWRHAGR